jgi:hypothetical protein
MNLVQKLPISLALAGCMMISSCSQEDVQVAQPEKGKTENSFSNERGVLQALPKIPTTDGPAGNNIFAAGWAKIITSSPDDPQKYQAGTSSKMQLWGDQNFPWTKPLLNPPGANNNNQNNFVTIMTQKDVLGNFENTTEATTKIKNLTPGKKYAVTISVATTICIINGQPTQYANGAMIEIPGTVGWSNGTGFDIINKKAEWVTKTIIFEAQSSEVPVTFKSDTHWFGVPPCKHLAYLHAFVDKDAIVEVP